MLKVIVVVPETSLLVVSGCGLGRVVGPIFSFVIGQVGLGWISRVVGWESELGWIGSKKMDPRTTICSILPPSV